MGYRPETLPMETRTPPVHKESLPQRKLRGEEGSGRRLGDFLWGRLKCRRRVRSDWSPEGHQERTWDPAGLCALFQGMTWEEHR